MTIIYTYAHSLITKARQAGRYSTADIYTSTLNKLFEFVFTGYKTTAKRAIPPQVIRKLVLLDLTPYPALCFSRDLFLLSFYLRGIPFVDLVHLRRTDVKQNVVSYYRHKTRQQLSVYIEPYAWQILRKYQTNIYTNSPISLV